MKRLLLSLLSVLSLLTACAAQNRLFNSLASMPDVSSVYMGNSALKLAGGSIALSGYGPNSDYVEAIELLEVISSEKHGNEMRQTALKIIEQLNLVLLLETYDADDHSSSHIYISEPDAEGLCKTLIIMQDEPGDFQLIHLDGKINANKLFARYANGRVSISTGF